MAEIPTDGAQDKDERPDVQALFSRLKADLPALECLLGRCADLGYEDLIYRFYHQSFKVYSLQDRTTAIVAALQALAPDRSLNEWFMMIVQEGTGKTFKPIVHCAFDMRLCVDSPT